MTTIATLISKTLMDNSEVFAVAVTLNNSPNRCVIDCENEKHAYRLVEQINYYGLSARIGNGIGS